MALNRADAEARHFRSPPSGSESTVSLLRRLVEDVSTLFQQELALATAEISNSISAAKRGLASMATGGAVLFGGFLVLLAAAVLGLSTVLVPWLAALIVGAVVALIGFVMVRAGASKLDPEALKPSRTQESLRRDKEVFDRRVS